MQSHTINNSQTAQKSWMMAYRSFLMSRDENMMLKIAPFALLLGSPEIIISNLIPVVGEVVDVGSITLSLVVAYKTYNAVKKYR